TPADTAELSLTDLIEWRYHAYKLSCNSE
ncbi:MAG: GpE family phage tail protein, partial [Morganella morganii]|nr:GpE family phage tail protein [Morganella morganii]